MEKGIETNAPLTIQKKTLGELNPSNPGVKVSNRRENIKERRKMGSIAKLL